MNAFAIAWDSIWHHRTRSLLTALGVVIGVFAVVTLTSLGGGVKTFVTGQFSTFGANIVTVTPASPHTAASSGGFGHHGHGGGGGGGFGGGAPSTLTLGDVTAIEQAKSPAISAVVPIAEVPELISHGGTTANQASVLGTSSAYFGAEHLKFAKGRFPQAGQSGVVIGSKLAKTLFGSKASTALGQSVTIGSDHYTVTGVLTSSGNLFGGNPDTSAYIPAAQAVASAPGHTLTEILVIANGNSRVTAATAAAQTVLLARHPAHNFALTSSQQILSTVQGTLTVVTDFVAGLAAISLLVGGIGIMNIMLVTVAERFREIGVRKALGARDGDILLQFLSESVLLALLGGIVGMLFAALVTYFVGKLVGIPAGLTTGSVTLAMGFSIVVGAVFGVLPAMRAAHLMPAEALRSD